MTQILFCSQCDKLLVIHFHYSGLNLDEVLFSLGSCLFIVYKSTVILLESCFDR